MKLLRCFVLMFVFSSLVRMSEAFWDDDNEPKPIQNYRGLIKTKYRLVNLTLAPTQQSSTTSKPSEPSITVRGAYDYKINIKSLELVLFGFIMVVAWGNFFPLSFVSNSKLSCRSSVYGLLLQMFLIMLSLSDPTWC